MSSIAVPSVEFPSDGRVLHIPYHALIARRAATARACAQRTSAAQLGEPTPLTLSSVAMTVVLPLTPPATATHR